MENRLPSAAHGVAAAGGRSLNDPSAPSVGGSEGPSTEGADFSPSSGTGRGFRDHHAETGRVGDRGHDRHAGSRPSETMSHSTIVLFDVSTDKVDSEIPSPYDGTILDILVNAGETVPVGTVLARIGAVGSEMDGSAGNGTGAGSSRAARQATAVRASHAARHRLAAPPPVVDAVVTVGAQARRRERHRRGDRNGDGRRWADPA